MSTRNIFIVVLSPEAVTSNWVNDEIDIAWSRKNDPDFAKGMRLFPVMYQTCKIRPSLGSLQIISFVLKSYEDAFGELLEALELEASTNQTTQQAPITPQKTKEQWIEEGDTHYNAQQYKKASADYDRAIELDPQDAVVYLNRGAAYDHLKQYKKAIADFARAIKLDPQYTLADYDRAIQLNPKHAKAKTTREQAMSLMEKLDAQ